MINDNDNDHRVQDELELLELQSRYEHLSLSREYGYGIVDKDGNPYWDESCVCQDPEPMQDQVKLMNEDFGLDVMKSERAPYRVVRLMYQEMD